MTPGVDIKTQKPLKMFVMVHILCMKFIDGVLSIGAHFYGAFHMTGDAEKANIRLFLGVLP